VFIGYLVPVVGCVVALYLMGVFLVRFDRRSHRYFAEFVFLNLIVSYLFYIDAIGTLDFCLIESFISFRVTGSYVLYSIIQRPYNGRDLTLYFWLCVMLFGRFVMAPVPVSLFYSKLLPYTGDFLYGTDVQQLFPYFLYFHITKANIQELYRNYYILVR